MTAPRKGAMPLRGEPVETLSPAVPLGYFGLAICWLIAGAVGLIVIAPDLARGNLFAPRIFAVVHALTIGVVTSAIFGALHQFLPAVVGMSIRHPRAAAWGLGSLLLGVPVLVTGFWHWRPALQGAGWVILFIATGMASWNVLPARRRAVRNHYVGGFVSLAHSALGAAVLLAGARIGHGLGWWEVDRVRLVSAHLNLGLVGFGTLTAVAFTSKMLPAFLGSRTPPDRRVVLVGWTASAGLLLHTAGAIVPADWLMRVGGAGILGAGLLYLTLLGVYFGRRTTSLDPGLAFITAGAVFYLGAVVTGAGLLLEPGPPGRRWALYVFLGVVGWLVMLIVGVMHRVAPRLTTLWIARRGARIQSARVELLSPGIGWISFALATAGIVVSAVGIGLGASGTARAGTVIYLGATLLFGVQGMRLARFAIARP